MVLCTLQYVEDGSHFKWFYHKKQANKQKQISKEKPHKRTQRNFGGDGCV